MRSNKLSFESQTTKSYQRIRDYIKFLCRNESEADDLTQETFVKAFQYYDRFDHRSCFETWMITIAKNLFLDKARRLKRRVQTVSSESAMIDDTLSQFQTAGEVIFSEEVDEVLSRVLSDLDEDSQRILQLIIVDQFNFLEAGAMMKLPARVVNARYYRILRSVRIRYDELTKQRDTASRLEDMASRPRSKPLSPVSSY